MNEQSKYILITIALVIALFLGLYFLTGKPVDWRENYVRDNKAPYGLYMISSLLETLNGEDPVYFSDQSFEELLEEENIEEGNYLLIGRSMHMDSSDFASLLDFVGKGNNAFISVTELPLSLKDRFFPSCMELIKSVSDSVAVMTLPETNQNHTFRYKFVMEHEPQVYYWKYFSFRHCGENPQESLSALGYVDIENPNFIRIPHELGSFYIHMAPLVYTNYTLKDNEEALEYAENSLSAISDGAIIWDEYNKSIHSTQETTTSSSVSKSPLSFILSQESLRWAWYTLLVLAFLYILIYSRRKQRAIPVLEKPSNSSIEFTETIGDLYFQQNNHKKLANHIYRLFLQFLLNKYQLRGRKPDSKLKSTISKKSGVDIEEVNTIFKYFSFIRKSSSINEKELIRFHQMVNNFYKKAR